MSNIKIKTQHILLLISVIYWVPTAFSAIIYLLWNFIQQHITVPDIFTLLTGVLYLYNYGTFHLGLLILVIYLKYIGIIKSNKPIIVIKILGIVCTLIAFGAQFVITLFLTDNIILSGINSISYLAIIGVMLTTDSFLFGNTNLPKKLIYTVLVLLSILQALAYPNTHFILSYIVWFIAKLPPYITLIIAVWLAASRVKCVNQNQLEDKANE